MLTSRHEHNHRTAKTPPSTASVTRLWRWRLLIRFELESSSELGFTSISSAISSTNNESTLQSCPSAMAIWASFQVCYHPGGQEWSRVIVTPPSSSHSMYACTVKLSNLLSSRPVNCWLNYRTLARTARVSYAGCARLHTSSVHSPCRMHMIYSAFWISMYDTLSPPPYYILLMYNINFNRSTSIKGRLAL